MTRLRALLPPWASGRALAGLLCATAALAAVPAVADVYTHNLLTLAFLSVSGALAWNWMGGYVGQVSFGHAAFFGLGGFVSARILLAAPVPPPLAWLAGGLVAGLLALGAHPTLRLRGPYFSIATIGVGEATRVIFTYWERFTGGSSGLSLPVDPGLKHALYGWSLALLALVAAGSYAIRRSTLGLKLLAIKADVDAAADAGVAPALHQDLVLVLSAAVVGLTGALYASYFSFIEPNDMLGFDRSISYPQLYLGLYGALLIVIILFEPLGLTGLALRLARRFGYRSRPDLALGSAASRPSAATGERR
jgi:branched-chain amino acid transport system permease protein